jgi:hypothetical protein
VTITLTGLALAATLVVFPIHPFPTLLHPAVAVLRLPHEQKMSSDMTELMPVLPDPMRRRRRYVLCLATLPNKELYPSFRNNSLFTVWGDLLCSSEAASDSTFS